MNRLLPTSRQCISCDDYAALSRINVLDGFSFRKTMDVSYCRCLDYNYISGNFIGTPNLLHSEYYTETYKEENGNCQVGDCTRHNSLDFSAECKRRLNALMEIVALNTPRIRNLNSLVYWVVMTPQQMFRQPQLK